MAEIKIVNSDCDDDDDGKRGKRGKRGRRGPSSGALIGRQVSRRRMVTIHEIHKIHVSSSTQTTRRRLLPIGSPLILRW